LSKGGKGKAIPPEKGAIAKESGCPGEPITTRKREPACKEATRNAVREQVPARNDLKDKKGVTAGGGAIRLNRARG